jgi:hypothetical protein
LHTARHAVRSVSSLAISRDAHRKIGVASAIYTDSPIVSERPRKLRNHSQPNLAGGFDVPSSVTRLMSRTLLMMHVTTRAYLVCAHFCSTRRLGFKALTRNVQMASWKLLHLRAWMNEARDRITLPQLLTEREAAAALRVKPPTVRAERVRGKLGFVRIGARIFYTPEQLSQYLERQAVLACASNETNTQARSASIGSAKSPTETAPMTPGAAPGTTTALDKRVVSALAHQTFKRRSSGSRHGSSRTSGRRTRNRIRS